MLERLQLKSPTLWLVLVAFAFALVQFLLFDLDRAVDWDEAGYLSEAYADMEPIEYGGHRSRGIILLVAPIGAFGPPIWVVRLSLLIASGVALFGSFVTWQRTLGFVVPTAAALFASSWLTLLYGTEIYPNLWSAFAAVAAIGMIAEFIREPRTWRLAVVAGLLAVVGVIRPVDASVVGGAAVLFVLIYRPPLWSKMAVSITLGVVLGWVPWVGEAVVIWGGVGERLAAARSAFGEGVEGNVLLHHLTLADGPLMGPDSDAYLPNGGIAWWVFLLLFSIVGVALARSDDQRRIAVLVAVTGGAVAVFYLIFPGALAPRFLLPAYALLSIVAALGLLELIGRREGRVRFAMLVLLALLLVPWQLWNTTTASRLEAAQVVARADGPILGEFLRNEAQGERCVFSSQYGAPQIQFYSGCDGTRYIRGQDPVFPVGNADEPFLLTIIPPDQIELSSSEWRGVPVDGTRWYVYRPTR